MSTNDPSTQLVARPPLHPASFDRWNPDRWDHVLLYNLSQPHHFRYKLTILDRRVDHSTAIAYATAVLLIPAGRESEYLFQSRHGLQAIAESAQTARLIAVALGRQHDFASQAAIQAELTFTVQVLSRQGNFLPQSVTVQSTRTDIPFLALDGIGKRNVVAEGDTECSGSYVIEQVQVGSRNVRRLYFLDNPFVIQSEVSMRDDQPECVDRSFVAFDYHKTSTSRSAVKRYQYRSVPPPFLTFCYYYSLQLQQELWDSRGWKRSRRPLTGMVF